MTHDSTDSFLRGVIGDVVRDHLKSVHVMDVLVSREKFEDDDVLLVTVIIDDADADIDDDDVLALVSHIQPRLTAEHESAFPVISFSTSKEWEAAA